MGLHFRGGGGGGGDDNYLVSTLRKVQDSNTYLTWETLHDNSIYKPS